MRRGLTVDMGECTVRGIRNSPRAGRERSRLNMADRLNQVMRGEMGVESERKRERETRDQREIQEGKELVAAMTGLYRKEKLRKGKPLSWKV